jgi:hypothetical protein
VGRRAARSAGPTPEPWLALLLPCFAGFCAAFEAGFFAGIGGALGAATTFGAGVVVAVGLGLAVAVAVAAEGRGARGCALVSLCWAARADTLKSATQAIAAVPDRRRPLPAIPWGVAL